MVKEFDLLFNPDVTRDPYPVYARLRAEAPIARDKNTGNWLLSRYDDVLRILRDPERFSSRIGMSPLTQQRAIIIFTDPPDHAKMRGLISGAFTPRIVALQRTAIQEFVDVVMPPMCAKEDADVVEELAYPLPVQVIARMLGVEDGDVTMFKRWSDTFFENLSDMLVTGDESRVGDALREFDAYFTERIEQRRREPREDLLSALVHVETDEGRLTDEDLLMLCRVLLVAGNETTTSLIASSVRALAEFPQILARLFESPHLMPSAIEEALRFYPPFAGLSRLATIDVQMHGETIREGERVSLLIGSANRDESVFERPDEFVIDREPNRHLAFGMGIHYCVGAPLARLETHVALSTLLQRVERIELTEDQVTPPELLLPRCPKSLKVRLTPRQSASASMWYADSTADAAVRLIQEFCHAFMRRDVDELLAYFNDDAVYHNMPVKPAQGKDAIRAVLNAFVTPASHIEFRIDHIMGSADFVFTERVDSFVVEGRHIELPVAGTFEVAGGKICAWRDYFDFNAWSRQASVT